VLLVCVVVGIVTVRGRLNRLTAAATGRSRAVAAFDTSAGIVYSLDEEPANFNFLTSDGNEVAMLQIVDRVWPAVFHADPSATASPDRFTVTTTYSTPFADWRSLFSPVAPAHIMQRVGWNKGLLAANVSAGTFISAGPFLFTSYAAGRDFVLNRNPQYWGTPAN